jgi:hypothetical protein
VSVDEHIAAATYLLAGLTGAARSRDRNQCRIPLGAVTSGAPRRAGDRNARAAAGDDAVLADTLDIGRTMPLELPEDRDQAGIARLIERVRSESEDARRERALLNEYLAWWELTASSIHDQVQVFDPSLLELFASSRLLAVWMN